MKLSKMKPALLLPLLALCAACHTSDDSYEIDIRCSECSGARVSLCRYADGNVEEVSTEYFDRGHAEFKGKVDEPQLMYLYVEDSRDYLPLFVENSSIEVDYFCARPSRSVVTGSQCHKTFTDFLQSYSAYSDKGTGIDKMKENAAENADTLMLQRIAETVRVMEREKVEFQRQYVLQNITSPVSAYILSTDLMYHLSRSELDSVTALFPDQMRSSAYMKQVADYLKSLPRDTVSL